MLKGVVEVDETYVGGKAIGSRKVGRSVSGNKTCVLSLVEPNAKCQMPKAKPVTLPTKIKFDDAMRRAMRVPPPPSGKKAQKRVWRKKQRKG